MTFWSLTNSDFPTNQTFHQFHDRDTELDLHRLWVVSMEHLQRVWHASRERLPFRTPGSVPILGLANAPIVETKFLELAMSLLDFSPRIPLGTFSILLRYFDNAWKVIALIHRYRKKSFINSMFPPQLWITQNSFTPRTLIFLIPIPV